MSRRRLRSWITSAIALLLALGGLTVTAGFFHLRRSVQSLSGTVRLAALDSAVTVYMDPFAIPHIFAASEADVIRTQGYLHSSERLWQMELFRRVAQGRLAELFGEPALETDRFLRTIDLWGAAAASLDALPPSERVLLDAYAAGVNAKLESWSGTLPPEFLLLGIEPEPWEARASIAIGKMMTLDLSSWNTELARFRSSVALDEEKRAYLELPYPTWGPTILGEEETAEESPAVGLTDRREARVDRVRGEARGRPLAFEYLLAPSFSTSNGWAVAGRRSASGYPLLASDMHLPLRAPSTWYLNALHAENSGLHVAGLSIPGTPGVIVGYNREIAWAFTNGMVDDTDFTVEALNLDQSAYRSGDGWEPFETRVERIDVRGRADPVEMTVRSTVRGPLITDVLSNLGVSLSLLWTGHRTGSAASGLLAMNRATDPVAFDRAVRRLRSPHQNVIYATARGVIGYRLSGTIPIRDGWDGSRPVGFERLESGWEAMLEAESHPATVDPPVGFLASANNLQARGLYGVVGVDYPLPLRARRIVDRLAEGVGWTVDAMRGLQLDTHSLLAGRLVGRAIAAAERIGEEEVARTLAGWDLSVDLDSHAAPFFFIWLYRLRMLIAADELESAGEWEYFPDRALLKLLEEGGGPWVDDVRTDTTETLAGLEGDAMRTAVRETAGRSWGELHRERAVHPIGRVGWLDRLFGFQVGPYPAPGGRHTVRPDDPHRWAPLDSTSWAPPFENEYGPSERFVAEMRPGESTGYFLLPTGQSGNPLSARYRDMAPRWLDGDLIEIPLYLEAARALSTRTLLLLPR